MGALERLFGGSPVAVLLKLVFVSLLVGAIMAGLGLGPRLLLHRLQDAFEALFGYGFDALRNAGQYILTGAIIVVPIWLAARLLGARRR